ncbi:hypothetical protein GCM10009665_33690 [Kitasatospora nipponensis]|uniref:Uncharacterized protein n=1 Tax=Kitasatospora nipponensis TaxID=258049 RepID=A0ABN1W8B0_9ACTN
MTGDGPSDGPTAQPATGTTGGVDAAPGPEPLTPAETAAVARLRQRAAQALPAGVSGAGAVPQAELLRSAHQARLLGLHRPAALAATVVTGLRAARAAEPDHRLADLVAAYRELLETCTALLGPLPAADLRGTARQSYREAGGLRLYGLCAEPVVTATHAGAAVWLVDGEGRLATVADVLPHGDHAEAAELAQAASVRPVRLGDASLSHRELTRAGLVVQGATRTATGRLGAGAGVRAVRAAGAGWQQSPAAGLWAEPVAAQVERALRAERVPFEVRPAGSDLLFLDVTVRGPVVAAGGAHLLADCAGLPVALLPGHEHPSLAYRANLALLAAAPSLRLRVIGRLERAATARPRLLAAGPAPQQAGGADGVDGVADGTRDGAALRLTAERLGRVSLGLERLQHADLPAGDAAPLAPGVAVEAAAGSEAGALPPVHLLSRRVAQVVTGGRRALTPSGAQGGDEARALRETGLGTAAQLLTALRAAAVDQDRDVFGRLRTDDHLGFALAWLAAACYQEELANALCAAAWQQPG